MEKIKQLRNSLNMSQDKLAKIIGVSRSTVAMWEIGQSQPDNDMLSAIADFFNVSVDYLLERDNSPIPSQKGIKIPVLGNVAAGIPLYAIQEIVDYEEIDETMASQGEYFGLKIKGDSMEPRIKQNDVVIVRKQENFENGDVVIVLVNGDSATCKKIIKYDNGISLISFNPAYDPKFYTRKQVETLPVRILGKVVELRGKF